MGRYIYSANGDFDGKFWFGVQPSEDCEDIYGFTRTPIEDEEGEDSESWADVWQDDAERVRKALDEQFELAKIPKKERQYDFDSTTDIGNYVWDYLGEYFLQTTPAEPNDTGYFMGDGRPTLYPKNKWQTLAMARVELGLMALNDIRKHGECNWTIDLM